MSTRKAIEDLNSPGHPGIALLDDAGFNDVNLGHILDCLPQGIRLISKDHIVWNINKSFVELTGIRPEDAIGKKCWEVFPGPFCHTDSCRLKRILDGETMVQSEIGRQKSNGVTVPCIVTTSPLRTQKGELIGIMESFRDITEKKQLQEQAKESEDLYKALINLGTEAGEAIVMVQDIDGREGVQTYVSEQWLQITGYTREELLGTCFFDLLVEQDRQPSIERHRQKMAGIPVPGLYEMNIRRRDGAVTVIEITGAFTMFQGKKANVVYIRDITERRLAGVKLKESEERYRSLFEDVPVAIWELDYSDVKKYFDALRANGISDIRNYLYRHPEITLHCLQLGRAYGVNKAALKLWEAESKEELASIFDLIQKRPDGLARDRENFIALAEGATEISYINCELTFKGKSKYTSVQYRIAPGHENDWSRIFGSFFDVTERVEAEKELQAYQKHLKDLVDERTSQLKQEVAHSRFMEEKIRELYEKESQLRHELEDQINQRIQFTRAVVHELKTPLTPLIGANELLKANLKEDPWRKLAQQSYKGALELNKRIDELFDLTRNEIGVLKLDRIWIDPLEMMLQMEELISLQCWTSGHELCLDMPESLPQVYCDPQRLKHVLGNLIDNACRYTQPGTRVILRIGLENDKVLFQVEDAGPGIAEEKQRDIFIPYSKLEGRSEHHSGLGLGLSICKTFIDLHGGEIQVRSKPGEGSCFWFTIPVNGSPGNG